MAQNRDRNAKWMTRLTEEEDALYSQLCEWTGQTKAQLLRTALAHYFEEVKSKRYVRFPAWRQ